MKTILKPILKFYLKYTAKLVLLIHRPTIIAIAGSTNKSFVREEIRKSLAALNINVWANSKNFNTEIGLPLSILRIPQSGYNSYRQWLPVLVMAFRAIFQKNYPHVLVLELGISKSGDMKYLLSIVKPQIAIITDINQRYLESFSGMENLVGEYKMLIKNLSSQGLAVLNWDNSRVKNLAKFTKAKVITFGENEGADWHLRKIERKLTGEEIEISENKNIQSFQLVTFGRHNVQAFIIGLITSNHFQKNG